MRYQPAAAPQDVEALPRYIDDELARVGESFVYLDTLNVYLAKLASQPVRPRDGQVVYADGTNWDPGSGAGIYYFNGSTWNFLG